MKRLRYSLLLVAALAVLALRTAPVLAEAKGDEAVVPEGKDELLAQMLGKGTALPDGCKLEEGQVEYSTVKATYACANGEVVFELVHPSRAADAAAKTDRFALVLKSGSPPPGLVTSLESLIRARESAFEWKMVGPPASASRWQSSTLLAVAGLLAIAILGWMVRSRSSARRSETS